MKFDVKDKNKFILKFANDSNYDDGNTTNETSNSILC